MVFDDNNDNKIVEWLKNKPSEDGKKTKLLYAACVNSFSQGINRYDSDYDIHAVRYKSGRDFYLEESISRTEINKRYSDVINLGTHSRAHIELTEWNDIDFFSVIIGSEKDGRRISSTIYYILYATLYSRLVFDPLGVVPHILTICAPVCNMNKILDYFWRRAMSRTKDDAPVSLKQYMSRLHCYLSIIWIEKYKEFPPIDIHILLKIIKNQYLSNSIMSYFESQRYRECNEVSNDLLVILRGLQNECMEKYAFLMNRMSIVSEKEQMRAYRNVIKLFDIVIGKEECNF